MITTQGFGSALTTIGFGLEAPTHEIDGDLLGFDITSVIKGFQRGHIKAEQMTLCLRGYDVT